MLSLNLTENIIGKRGTLFITTIKLLSEKIISLKLYGWLNYPLYSSSSKQNCTKYLLVIVQNCQPWPQHLFWGCFDCYPVNIAVSVFLLPCKVNFGYCCYPIFSAVGVLILLTNFLAWCFDHWYFEWYLC